MQSVEAGHTTATTIFQLLAGAAPLAGGSLDLAWAPHGHDSRSRHTAADSSEPDDVSSSGQGTCRPVAKRMRLLSPPARETRGGGDSVWQMASGGLKHLMIDFHTRDVDKMPARWCSALAQLVTLQDLRIHLGGKFFDSRFIFCMPEFKAALLSLPALSKVGISFDLDKRSGDDDVIRFTYATTVPLLDSISQMPQLSHLRLARCVNVHNGTGSLADPADVLVLSQLSRLSRLTCLHLFMYVAVMDPQQRSDLAVAYACGLKHLPALEKLQLVFECEESCAEQAAEEFVVELFLDQGFPALKDLHVSIDSEYARQPQPLLPFHRLHKSMQLHHKELLARMTSLRFGPPSTRHELQGTLTGDGHSSGDEHAGGGEDTCDSTALAAMLTAMTSLQSLSLADTTQGSKGLLCLARALPGLTALTHLDIANTCASESAVLAALAALLEHKGPGRERCGPSISAAAAPCQLGRMYWTWPACWASSAVSRISTSPSWRLAPTACRKS